MAYNETEGRAEYTASAGQTLFPFGFKIFFNSDIKVYLTPSGQPPSDLDDLLILTTDYTVSINGDLGGTLTLVNPSSANDSVTIVRTLPLTRPIEYQTNGDMLADTLNTDQDYQTYLTADQVADAGRFISIPISAQNINTNLPDVAADSYLKWNSAGDALENDNTIPDNVFNSEDSNLEAGSWANENESVPVKKYTKGIPSDRVPTVYSAKHHSNKAGTSATNAQLSEWNAEAEAMTADSYATEPEDVFVKTYSSNGDGTFTPTDTTEYSSLHYSRKTNINNSNSTNKLINGDFRINQREYVSGTATVASNEYTLDRWRVVTLGESVSWTTTNGIVEITAPAGGIEQVIESIYIGTFTLSFKGTATILVSESVDNITYTDITANADGSYTTTGYNYIRVRLINGTASMVQFEEGTVATPFEQRLIGYEQSLCQRYYNSSVVGSTFIVSNGQIEYQFQSSIGNSATIGSSFEFGSVFRVYPTITLYSPSTGASGKVRNSSLGTDALCSAGNISTRRFTIVNNDVTFNDQSKIRFHWTADAEL